MSKTVYEMVTDRIIEQLESGVIPWELPWHGSQNGAYNRISRKPYSLLNQMLLKHKGGEYATFKQWSGMGGKIRKGAKAEIVVFWKIYPIEETQTDGTKVMKQIPLLRYYNVFHVSDVEGVAPLEAEERKPVEPIAEAERVKEEYKSREGIQIMEMVTDEAYYSPARDYIKVPCKEQFKEIEEFYSTLFHEMVHSTGHKSRLDRMGADAKIASFGSEEYSREELTAEVGSATLLNILGIETKKTFRNSAAYIQNWLQVLKNDSKFIVIASGKAEKAVKYILNES